MEQTKCNACGHAIEAGAAVVHQIVPEEAKKLFGISDSSTTMLCNDCWKPINTTEGKSELTITR